MEMLRQYRLFYEVPNMSDCFLSGTPDIPDDPPEYKTYEGKYLEFTTVANGVKRAMAEVKPISEHPRFKPQNTESIIA